MRVLFPTQSSPCLKPLPQHQTQQNKCSQVKQQGKECKSSRHTSLSVELQANYNMIILKMSISVHNLALKTTVWCVHIGDSFINDYSILLQMFSSSILYLAQHNLMLGLKFSFLVQHGPSDKQWRGGHEPWGIEGHECNTTHKWAWLDYSTSFCNSNDN